MPLRRLPRQTNRFGINWTMWPWPSKVAGAIWRHFFPRPADFDSPRRYAIRQRLAIAYFISVWTLGGVILYTFQKARKTEAYKDQLSKKREEFGNDELVEWARYLHKPEDLEGMKIRGIVVDGMRVVRDEQIQAVPKAKAKD